MIHLWGVPELFQFSGLRFCSDEDRNVRVGAFPECEEILIGGAALDRITLHRVGASQLEMGQRTDGLIQNNAAMVEDFLKLCCRFAALMCGKIGFSSHINGVQIRPIIICDAGKPSSYGAAALRASSAS